MEIIFLGSGTSTGIPQIGCRCEVCSSADPKDKRLRASVLIRKNGHNLLIDCGPDMRQQLIRANVRKLSGILITHEHYDHIGGLDDVRPLGETHLYAEKEVLSVIRRNMPYSFAGSKYPGLPVIHLHEIKDKQFEIAQEPVLPIRVMHAKLPILGYRIGSVAYLTDVKTISDESMAQLKDLDILIINALRHEPHFSHLSLSESLKIVEKVRPKQTYLTHMSHDMGKHQVINSLLPPSVHLAYDGLIISL